MWGRIARRAFGQLTHDYQPRAKQVFINNRFQPAVSGKTFDVVNPFTERVITQVSEGDKADVDLAVASSRRAFDEGPWRRMSGYERGRLLSGLADLIEKNSDELAFLESLDNGKPLWNSKNQDLFLAISTFRYYAGLADKIHGETIPLMGPYFCYTRKEPIGVAGQIIPWNFPLLMATWKLAPALAAGCTVVLKPAEQTPLTALRLGELIAEAGFPEGVVNIVPGFAAAGQAIVNHPGVDKVAFTGSTEIGKSIIRNSSTANLKRVTLELGGKSANIILDDADIDLAVAQAQVALFFNMGQCCIAGSRTLVHANIYDKFVEKTVEASKKRVLGDPLQAGVDQGPQIDKDQFDKIMSYISKGKQEGAALLTGGHQWGSRGYFVEPTVFANCTDNMTIVKEEIFGPVFSILKFNDLDEVVKRANASNYGLGAGVVTRDIEKAFKLANALKAGTVYVNCYDVILNNTPFGGFKDSGIGRELGLEGVKNYLENKTVIFKTADDALP
jgi:aldehyde dehydrogenase (NAD+)